MLVFGTEKTKYNLLGGSFSKLCSRYTGGADSIQTRQYLIYWKCQFKQQTWLKIIVIFCLKWGNIVWLQPLGGSWKEEFIISFIFTHDTNCRCLPEKMELMSSLSMNSLVNLDQSVHFLALFFRLILPWSRARNCSWNRTQERLLTKSFRPASTLCVVS